MSILSTPSPVHPNIAPSNERSDISETISQNIENVAVFNQQENSKIHSSQRYLETIGAVVGRPAYVITLLAVLVIWIAGNGAAAQLGYRAFDPPPFYWLHLLMTLVALITATIVLVTQNRQAALDKQRADLDLQVNLLTEQKVTKLIHLIEELRLDLPIVRNRHDPVATAFQQNTDTAKVLSALQNSEIDAAALLPSRASPERPTE